MGRAGTKPPFLLFKPLSKPLSGPLAGGPAAVQFAGVAAPARPASKLGQARLGQRMVLSLSCLAPSAPQFGHCSFFSPFRKSRNPMQFPQTQRALRGTVVKTRFRFSGNLFHNTHRQAAALSHGRFLAAASGIGEKVASAPGARSNLATVPLNALVAFCLCQIKNGLSMRRLRINRLRWTSEGSPMSRNCSKLIFLK